jgi:16S rRNA (guanine527-N7)-methyltransferase
MIRPTDAAIDQLVSAFLAENEKINLSALRTPEACRIGNVLDSLAFLDIVERIGEPKTLLDVGTGGGFPLLPLALALPQSRLSGMDSTGKKIDAIARIAQALGIGNVMLSKARAEDAGHDKAHREQYDVATARALAATATLAELLSPFVKIGGHVVLWKSMHAGEEIAAAQNALKLCKLDLAFTHTYALPGDFGERQLLVLKKTGPLPRMYPRENGMPGKMPL